jgi:hypothetical protein
MRASLRIGRLAFAAAAAAAVPVAAGEPLPCRPTFVPCNYAEHFSGTLHWKSVLGAETDELTVTVVDGKAACRGSLGGTKVQGPGKLAVERGISMEDAPGQPWYDISVSCPEPDGRVRDVVAGQIRTYQRKDGTGFTALAGKVDEENPDADPANGVTGTIHLDWSLSRPAGAAP